MSAITSNEPKPEKPSPTPEELAAHIALQDMYDWLLGEDELRWQAALIAAKRFGPHVSNELLNQALEPNRRDEQRIRLLKAVAQLDHLPEFRNLIGVMPAFFRSSTAVRREIERLMSAMRLLAERQQWYCVANGITARH